MCIRDRYCDERWRKRETEIFNVNRDYEMLVESLDIEREEKIYLPCDATVVADDDNDAIDDLPYNVTGVAHIYGVNLKSL